MEKFTEALRKELGMDEATIKRVQREVDRIRAEKHHFAMIEEDSHGG